jgi:hypothetical protein
MLLKAGFDARRASADYDYFSWQQRFTVTDGTLRASFDSTRAVATPTSTSLGAYVAQRVRPWQPLTLEVGAEYARHSTPMTRTSTRGRAQIKQLSAPARKGRLKYSVCATLQPSGHESWPDPELIPARDLARYTADNCTLVACVDTRGPLAAPDAVKWPRKAAAADGARWPRLARLSGHGNGGRR